MYKQRNYINTKERVFFTLSFEGDEKNETRYENLSCV